MLSNVYLHYSCCINIFYFSFFSPSLFALLQLSASSGGPAGGRGWGFWQRWQGNYVLCQGCTHTQTYAHCLRWGWHRFTHRKHKQTNEMTPSSPPISSPVQLFSLPGAQTRVQRLYNLLTFWEVSSVGVYTAHISPFILVISFAFGLLLQVGTLSWLFPFM